MPPSCLLTTHSVAAGVRALFERIDEMRPDARNVWRVSIWCFFASLLCSVRSDFACMAGWEEVLEGGRRYHIRKHIYQLPVHNWLHVVRLGGHMSKALLLRRRNTRRIHRQRGGTLALQVTGY